MCPHIVSGNRHCCKIWCRGTPLRTGVTLIRTKVKHVRKIYLTLAAPKFMITDSVGKEKKKRDPGPSSSTNATPLALKKQHGKYCPPGCHRRRLSSNKQEKKVFFFSRAWFGKFNHVPWRFRSFGSGCVTSFEDRFLLWKTAQPRERLLFFFFFLYVFLRANFGVSYPSNTEQCVTLLHVLERVFTFRIWAHRIP